MAVPLFGNLQVGHKLGEGVAAIEVLGIPLFAFLESGRFAHFGFGQGKLLHRHLFRSQRATIVSRLHIANDNMIRGAVADEMMHVEEPIYMLCVAHHFGMKQPATIEFERLDEFAFLGLKVRNLFDGKAEFLFFQINGLQRLSLVTQLNSCEKNRMGLYH